MGIFTMFTPKHKQVTTPAVASGNYVDECFKIDFHEYKDIRNWADMPDAKAVAEAGNANRFKEALVLTKNMQRKYRDFWFPYYWLNVLYRKQGKYDEARRFLNEGLRFSKSKFDLCAQMGILEEDIGNLPAAINWWIKSIVIQISANECVNDEPFFKLSYIAEHLGLSKPASSLRKYVIKIQGKFPSELSSGAARRLYMFIDSIDTKAIRNAIELLDSKYLL